MWGEGRTIADVPMGDTVPMNGVISGPRSYRWGRWPRHRDLVEALDKGDLRNEVQPRSHPPLFAPFKSEPTGWTNSISLRRANGPTTAPFAHGERPESRTTRTWVLRQGRSIEAMGRKQGDPIRIQEPADARVTGNVQQSAMPFN